jgi:hypothetical protein
MRPSIMLDLYELMGTYGIINIVYPVQAAIYSIGAGDVTGYAHAISDTNKLMNKSQETSPKS